MLHYVQKKTGKQKIYSGGLQEYECICVCLLLNIFCLVYMRTNFIMKNKDPHGSLLLAYRPYANGCFQLIDLILLFSLLSTPSRSPPRLLPFSSSLLSV